MDFENVSGNLALDLVGTLWWRRDRPRDLIAASNDAESWVQSAGLRLITPFSVGDDERLRALRELIYRESARRLEDRIPALSPMSIGPSEMPSLLAIARETPAYPELDERGQIHWVGNPSAVLSTIARSALDLFDHAQSLMIRECGSQRCTRLFIDRSRGKRVWCGMSTCGNREKAARWRKRHLSAGRDARS